MVGGNLRTGELEIKWYFIEIQGDRRYELIDVQRDCNHRLQKAEDKLTIKKIIQSLDEWYGLKWNTVVYGWK